MKKEEKYRVFAFLSSIVAFAIMVVNAYLHKDELNIFTTAVVFFLILDIVFIILAVRCKRKYRNQ